MPNFFTLKIVVCTIHALLLITIRNYDIGKKILIIPTFSFVDTVIPKYGFYCINIHNNFKIKKGSFPWREI